MSEIIEASPQKQKSNSKEPREPMFACQYLYAAAECFIRGIAHYNNPSYGNLERSFSEIHRAWNATWMADVIAKQNGQLLYGSDRTYGIEHFVSQSDEDFAKNSENMGYDYSKAATLFQDLMSTKVHTNLKDAPSKSLQANYTLMYKLRNINQHDFLESHRGHYGDIIFKLNPYVAANLNNFLQVYAEVRLATLADCKANHRKSLGSRACMSNQIRHIGELGKYITIPFSLEYILDSVGVKITATVNRTNKVMGKYLISALDEIIQKTVSTLTAEERKSQLLQINTGNTFLDLSNKTIQKDKTTAINLYEYGSLVEVAKAIIYKDKTKKTTQTEYLEVDALRKKIQHQKELIEKRNQNTNSKYWMKFWGKTRYTKTFASYVAEEIGNNAQRSSFS